MNDLIIVLSIVIVGALIGYILAYRRYAHRLPQTFVIHPVNKEKEELKMVTELINQTVTFLRRLETKIDEMNDRLTNLQRDVLKINRKVDDLSLQDRPEDIETEEKEDEEKK